MVWPSLDSLSATTFSRPRMCRALRINCFSEHQVRIIHKGHTEGPTLPPPPPPPPPLLVYVGNHCGVVCSYKYYVVQAEVWELL